MKRHTFQKSLLVLLTLTALSFNCFSQFVDGYVIKESNDTIYGKLKYMNLENSCEKIKFLDQDGQKVKFKINEVLSYKRGENIFVKKSIVRPLRIIGGMMSYMQLISDGKVKLYKFGYSQYNAGAPGPNGVVMGGTHTYKEDYYIEKNGQHKLVRQFGFKKDMSVYFNDDPELSELIRSKRMRYRNLPEIVEKYNQKSI